MASENSPIESGLDVLIAVLYARGKSGNFGEPVKGITRLQKLLFLLWKEAGFYKHVKDLYGFDAYDFGPCMDDLYDDIDFGVEIGLIQEIQAPTGNEYDGADEEKFLQDFGFKFSPSTTRRDYSLTESGMEAGADLYTQLSPDDQAKLDSIKFKFNTMPFFDLLRYVYHKYPNFAKRSILSL